MKLDPTKPDDPLVWSIKDQGASKAGVWGTPALWKDVLYTDTNGGRLLGIDRATGAIRWEKKLPGPTWQSPVVVDDVLIVGDCSGVLHAYDVSDTTIDPPELWTVKLERLHRVDPRGVERSHLRRGPRRSVLRHRRCRQGAGHPAERAAPGHIRPTEAADRRQGLTVSRWCWAAPARRRPRASRSTITPQDAPGPETDTCVMSRRGWRYAPGTSSTGGSHGAIEDDQAAPTAAAAAGGDRAGRHHGVPSAVARPWRSVRGHHRPHGPQRRPVRVLRRRGLPAAVPEQLVHPARSHHPDRAAGGAEPGVHAGQHQLGAHRPDRVEPQRRLQPRVDDPGPGPRARARPPPAPRR